MIFLADDAIVVVSSMARTRRKPRVPAQRRTTAQRLDAVERGLETLRLEFQLFRDEMRLGFSEMRHEMRARFAAVDQRFDAVDRRLEAVDRRLDAVDRRLDAVDRRFDGIDQRLDGLTDIVQRMYTEHGQRLKDIEDRFTNHTAA